MTHGRMILRHIRKKFIEKRTDDPGKKIYRAGFLADIHKTEEECHNAYESDRDLHAGIGGIKYAVNDDFENFRVARGQPHGRGQKSKQKEKDP